MENRMIPDGLLAELAALVHPAQVIEIPALPDRRSPIVLDSPIGASFCWNDGEIEIEYDGHTVVICEQVLDFIELFRRLQQCGRA